MRRTALAAVAVVLGISACGGADPDSPEGVAKSFVVAVEWGDAKTVCSLVGRELKFLITGVSTSAGGHEVSCEAGFRAGPRMFTSDAKMKSPATNDVNVTGQKATVTVEDSGRSVKVWLEKENGDWKVVDLRE